MSFNTSEMMMMMIHCLQQQEIKSESVGRGDPYNINCHSVTTAIILPYKLLFLFQYIEKKINTNNIFKTNKIMK